MHIAKRHRVSEHTVRAIRAREAQAIAERKQRLISIFGNVAEMSAERMEELVGQASLRDAGVSAGIATDKLLALHGDPGLTIHYQHTHNHQVELINALNKAIEDMRKARATVIDAPALPAPSEKETHLVERTNAHRKRTSRLTHQLAEKTPRKKKVC